MAVLKDLIVNGASRILENLYVGGNITSNGQTVVTTNDARLNADVSEFSGSVTITPNRPKTVRIFTGSTTATLTVNNSSNKGYEAIIINKGTAALTVTNYGSVPAGSYLCLYSYGNGYASIIARSGWN